MLKISVKPFNKLSLDELYAILQLRSEVFVVEQDCIYQDVDDKDQKALHIIGYKNAKIVAYTRIFKPGDYFDLSSIGRVVVKDNERKNKYGYTIMQASMEAIKKYYNETTVKISAQCYLEKFYNNLGFKQEGKPYLEDGIPHITMIKTL